MKFSILLPTYKGTNYIKYSLDSIFNQSYKNFEVLIGDDNPNDSKQDSEYLLNILKRYPKNKIKIFKNPKNLGVCKNLNNLFKKANGEIIFLISDDDIVKKNTLKNYYKIFLNNRKVGLITRPYFWFYKNLNNVVREIKPISSKNLIYSIKDSWEVFFKSFETAGQISGLAFRKKYLKILPHRSHVFTTHIYSFAQVARDHEICYYKDQNVAVRIEKSQTRHVKKIYNLSPTLTWIQMYNKVFKNNKFLRKWGIKHICSTNHVGLLQIKNYSTYNNLIKEIFILIKFWPVNLLNINFLFIVLFCLIIPKVLSRIIVDWTKEVIISKNIKKKLF